VKYLKEINKRRNRLHFIFDFEGAFEVNHHIQKWEFIKNTSTSIIEQELAIINEELKNQD
jgi:hypothetical protein